MALEKDFEEKCRQLVIERNGEFLKFVSPGNNGVHDRLLLLPDFVALVELKKPGKRKARVQPLQDYWQSRFTQLGMHAYRVSTLAQFIDILTHAADVHRRKLRRQDQVEFRGS
jgi:hypothetical protein